MESPRANSRALADGGLDRLSGPAVDTPMAEAPHPKRRKLTLPHFIVLAVWGLVCGWLVIPLFIGVISALFFGNGPIDAPFNPPERAESTLAAPDHPPSE